MDESPRSAYLARCHCGVLSARYATAVAIASWGVRACQCSFCRAHDALSVSDPQGLLEFSATDAAQLQRYRFGSGMTDFLLCRRCGVYLGARLATEPFGIINARALVPIPVDLPLAEPMNYASETANDKKTRRQARWTPLTASSL